MHLSCYSGFVQDRFESLISFYREVIVLVMQIKIGIVIYLHIEDALYAQKSVPSWFLAVFDSKIDVC